MSAERVPNQSIFPWKCRLVRLLSLRNRHLFLCLQATPSPVALSPAPVSPVGDALSFMGFYTEDDIVNLEKWAIDSRGLWGTPDFRTEEPEISPNLKIFLRFTIGAQWEYIFVHPAGEVLICQLRAYPAGYNLQTNFNRRQRLQLFPAWTLAERREQLELLANSGGFMDL